MHGRNLLRLKTAFSRACLAALVALLSLSFVDGSLASSGHLKPRTNTTAFAGLDALALEPGTMIIGKGGTGNLKGEVTDALATKGSVSVDSQHDPWHEPWKRPSPTPEPGPPPTPEPVPSPQPEKILVVRG